MKQIKTPDTAAELIKQFEGVENNAAVMEALAFVYEKIAEKHPTSATNFVVTMEFLDAANKQAWEGMKEMQQLPEAEQHYLFNGELSALESFTNIVLDAFQDETLDDTTRPAKILARAAEESQRAIDSVAEPLSQIRFLQAQLEAGLISDLNITVE